MRQERLVVGAALEVQDLDRHEPTSPVRRGFITSPTKRRTIVFCCDSVRTAVVCAAIVGEAGAVER